jgi:hypothetical protein
MCDRLVKYKRLIEGDLCGVFFTKVQKGSFGENIRQFNRCTSARESVADRWFRSERESVADK